MSPIIAIPLSLANPHCRCRTAACLAVLMALGVCVAAVDARADDARDDSPVASEILAGISLERALVSLRDGGLPLVFTSQLVQSEMRVVEAPALGSPRDVLAAVLRPHGLEARDGPGGRILIVASPRSSSTRAAASPATNIESAPLSTTSETIEVVASRPWILGDSPSSLVLDREDLVAMPQVGNDIFRSLAWLPGASTSDASAKLSVRGGRDDGVLVRLDGVEILDAYHLQDFGSVLGIVTPEALGKVELQTGGYSAEFGDRMSGVLELESLEPSWRQQRELGVTVYDARAVLSGVAQGDPEHDGEFSWLGSARGGTLEIPLRFADEQERPVFWDAFGKVEWRRTPRGSMTANLLASSDRLSFADIAQEGGDRERFDTRYRSLYAWTGYQDVPSSGRVSNLRLSASHLGRDRFGRGDQPGRSFEIDDRRELLTLTLAHDWHWQLGDRGRLRAGVEGRRLDVDYDYSSRRDSGNDLFETDPPDPRATALARRFIGEHVSAWVSWNYQPVPKLSVEAGLRFDRNTVLDDDHLLSPRLSLRYAASPRRLFHAAIGRYSQSQRLYELQVEDGVVDFSPSERALYWSVGYEHVFSDRLRLSNARRPLTLRAEIYRRDVDDPRIRFQNLYDPISKVPELESDRFRLDPQGAEAYGFELFVGGASGRRVDWFATYTYARSTDRLDDGFGLRDIPSQRDQPHALGASVVYHGASGYGFQLIWTSHSGWPTTDLRAQTIDSAGGQVVETTLGPLRADRLPDYHRLDVRVARTWTTARGAVEVYLAVHNVLGRRNVRGYDVSLGAGSDGSPEVIFEEESWGSVLPSVGARLRF